MTIRSGFQWKCIYERDVKLKNSARISQRRLTFKSASSSNRTFDCDCTYWLRFDINSNSKWVRLQMTDECPIFMSEENWNVTLLQNIDKYSKWWFVTYIVYCIILWFFMGNMHVNKINVRYCIKIIKYIVLIMSIDCNHLFILHEVFLNNNWNWKKVFIVNSLFPCGWNGKATEPKRVQLQNMHQLY